MRCSSVLGQGTAREQSPPGSHVDFQERAVLCFVTRSLLWLIIAMKQTPWPAVAAVLCKVQLFGALLLVGSAV